jgi:phenylalanyl-tRNA synthetase beta chain
LEIPRCSIEFPPAEVRRITGLDLDAASITRILARLGFEIEPRGANLGVVVPSWRTDIHGKADIAEEVVRIIGVDRIPAVPFERGEAPRKPVLTSLQVRRRKAARALAARGMLEAVTWSFIARDQAQLFGGGSPELALRNPIASDLSDMRPSLLPGLTQAAQKNADRGCPDVALFEVGQIFRGAQPESQLTAVAGVRRRLAKVSGAGRHWSAPPAEVDAYDAKADALAALAAAGAPAHALQVVQGGPAWFHPGRSGAIQIGPQNVLGYFGELHPRALEALDADGPVVGFEIVLENVPESRVKPTRAKPPLELSSLQPVERDFAFVVDRTVPASDIIRATQSADRKLISKITIFDLYEGKGIDADKKSIGVAVTLQPREKTMTDQEIDAIAKRIVAEVGKRTGAILRG